MSLSKAIGEIFSIVHQINLEKPMKVRISKLEEHIKSTIERKFDTAKKRNKKSARKAEKMFVQTEYMPKI